MPDDKPLPEETVADLVIKLCRAGVNLIPGGGVVTELASILKLPYERRRDEWLEALWERLARLEERLGGFDTKRLADSQQFVTAVLQATPIAVRTHKAEKLEALRNAVLNVAAGRAPEDDTQAMFLDAVDSLTALHVRFLSALGKARVAPESQSLKDAVVERSRKEGRLAAVGARLSFTREWMHVNTSTGDLLFFVDPFSEPPDVLHCIVRRKPITESD